MHYELEFGCPNVHELAGVLMIPTTEATILTMSEWSVQPPAQWDVLWIAFVSTWAIASIITVASMFKSRSDLAGRLVWAIACFVVPIVAIPLWWGSRLGRKAPASNKLPPPGERS